MRILFFCLSMVSILTFSYVVDAADEGKRQKIVKMIEVAGGISAFEGMVDMIVPNIIQQLQKASPNMTDEHVKEFSKLMQAEFKSSMGELMASMIPLYDKVLSEAEIDASIAFYSTPEGQSLMKKMPQIMQGGMMLGQQWGQQVGQRMAQKAVERARSLGYKI